jgi:hypothetical protein
VFVGLEDVKFPLFTSMWLQLFFMKANCTRCRLLLSSLKFPQQAIESIVILHNILHISTMNVNFEIYECILLQKSWTFSQHGPELYINKSFGMKISIWKIMNFDSNLHPHNHLSYTYNYTIWIMVFHENIFGFIMNGNNL